jgi:hypothetical protein
MVPVSVRSPGERGTYNNRVSAIFASLPVGIENPAERLDSIRRQMDGLKESKQAVGIHALTQLQDFAPPTLLALAGRQTVQQSSFAHLTVTNVPGPPHEIYLLGARLLELHPMVLIANTMTVNIAVQSLAGRLSIGLCADRDRLPDLDVLKSGIERALANMKDAASKRPAPKQPAAA